MAVLFKLSDEISFAIKTMYFLILRATVNLIPAAPQNFSDALGMISEGSFAGSIISVPESESVIFRGGYDSIGVLVNMQGFPSERCNPFTMSFQFYRSIICKFIDCDISVFLSISQFLSIRAPYDHHYPIVGF